MKSFKPKPLPWIVASLCVISLPFVSLPVVASPIDVSPSSQASIAPLRFTSPTQGMIVKQDQEVKIQLASANRRNVVDIFINGQLIASFPNLIYAEDSWHTWIADQTGAVEIKAVEYLSTQQKLESTVTIFVEAQDNGTPPAPAPDKLQFLLPAENQHYAYGADVLVKLAPKPQAQSLSLFVNGMNVAELNPSQPQFVWVADTEGPATVMVVERDQRGMILDESLREIYIERAITGGGGVTPNPDPKPNPDPNVNEVTLSFNLQNNQEVRLNVPLEIEAIASSEVKQVDLIVNGQTQLRDDSAPYQFTWTPTEQALTEVGLGATPISVGQYLILPSAILSVLPSAQLDYCEKVVPQWQADKGYTAGSIVRYQQLYFEANQFALDEPQLITHGGFSPWNLTSCLSVVDQTQPQVMAGADKAVYSDGDKVNLQVTITVPEGEDAQLASVQLLENNNVIQLLKPLEQQQVEYVFTGSQNRQLEVVATNKLGVKNSAFVELQANQLPIVNLSFNQNNNPTLVGGEPVALRASTLDWDGTVNQVDFFINGVKYAGNFVGFDGMHKIFGAMVTLPAGNYPVVAVATDNQGGKTTEVSTLVLQ